MDLIDKKLVDYCIRHTSEEPQALSELYRETHIKMLLPQMISGHHQGRLLSMISKMINPNAILEIGTFTAYGSLCLAEGLSREGVMHTIEINKELEDIINKYIATLGMQNNIRLHIGNALDIIPKLNQTFDLAFIDGDKKQYPQYLELLMPLINKGGYMLVDNVLWSGKVLDDPERQDADTLAISEFNEKIRLMKGIDKIMLPFRDGLYLIRKN